MDDTTAWEIEDLTEARSALGGGHTYRWMGVAIAVLAAVVGLGSSGRSAPMPALEPVPTDAPRPTSIATDVTPAPSTTDAFTLGAPTTGMNVERGLLEIRGTATQALGTLHLAVRLGDAVLGWTNIDVRGAGRVEAGIRIFAPPFDAPARLTIEGAGADGQTRIDVGVDILLRGVAGPAVWVALAGRDGPATTIEVEGFGPLGAEVQIDLSTTGGLEIGAVRAPITVADAKPGSVGARMIGLGSFSERLRLGRLPDDGVVVVRVGGSTAVISTTTKPGVSLERQTE